jgi:uncharacterized protein YndB with AHSA1/START domain
MSTITEDQAIQTIDIRKEELIAAPIEICFQAVLDELGPEAVMPDGSGTKPMQMKLEQFPGGRWFRDLGNNSGHLWGHVQVIKPPNLLEIIGPMAMSYPVANHMQWRLVAEGSSTRLKFAHRGMGLIPKEHRDGMDEGWGHWAKSIRERAEKLSAKQSGGKR